MSATSRAPRPHFAMLIEWSDEDQTYIASIPEFPSSHTHGDTYEEAVKQGKDLIDSLILWAQQDGKPLPQPRVFATP